MACDMWTGFTASSCWYRRWYCAQVMLLSGYEWWTTGYRQRLNFDTPPSAICTASPLSCILCCLLRLVLDNYCVCCMLDINLTNLLCTRFLHVGKNWKRLMKLIGQRKSVKIHEVREMKISVLSIGNNQWTVFCCTCYVCTDANLLYGYNDYSSYHVTSEAKLNWWSET